jgi:signal transduction histidine kinase
MVLAAVKALVDAEGGEAEFDTSERGSRWRHAQGISLVEWTADLPSVRSFENGSEDVYESLAIVPIPNGSGAASGFLVLASPESGFFTADRIDVLEEFADIIGIALTNLKTQAALRERVKELSCLYRIAEIVERPGTSLREILQEVVHVLPPAWQYPEVCEARIALDGQIQATSSSPIACGRQSAPIYVGKEKRGRIEVLYTVEMPALDEGPFLKEERNLLDTIAQQMSLIIERKQAEEEKAVLEDQLRHADRLATIGQLAAGVAHELNEPLGNILGFAQLAARADPQPPQVATDLSKIVDASLSARDVIRKLMLFSRQTPPVKEKVNLNDVVENGLSLLENRCLKQGIEIECNTAPELPEITADAGQLNQILVNLIVNALQAMPEGGTLAVTTAGLDDSVLLRVEDEGIGMSEEVLSRIFMPFYTTKDTDEGTGLGLSVVNGIVSSHGGFIKVESEPGRGSSFEVHLPIRSQVEE